LVGKNGQLRTEALTLGILAPPAPQGAAFEKDNGPDSRSVMNGKPLDVEDESLVCGFRSLFGGYIVSFVVPGCVEGVLGYHSPGFTRRFLFAV
jgi:hypothetical protein